MVTVGWTTSQAHIAAKWKCEDTPDQNTKRAPRPHGFKARGTLVLLETQEIRAEAAFLSFHSGILHAAVAVSQGFVALTGCFFNFVRL